MRWMQWRQLSINFILFFVALAALNEVLWRGIDLFMVQYFAAYLFTKRCLLQAWSATKPAFMVLEFCLYNVAAVALLQGKIGGRNGKECTRVSCRHGD